MTMRTNDNGTDRDMTAEEQAAYQAWAKIAQKEHDDRNQAQIDAVNAKESARAKLKALGLTDAEITALLGV